MGRWSAQAGRLPLVGVLFEISIVCLFFVPWFACFLVGGLVLSGGFVFWLWLLLCAVLCGVVCGGGCGWVLFFWFVCFFWRV